VVGQNSNRIRPALLGRIRKRQTYRPDAGSYISQAIFIGQSREAIYAGAVSRLCFGSFDPGVTVNSKVTTGPLFPSRLARQQQPACTPFTAFVPMDNCFLGPVPETEVVRGRVTAIKNEFEQ